MPFPGGTYLPPFRSGVLMMSSDLRDSCIVSIHRRRCLAYVGRFADRAAFLPSLPSDQSTTAYAGRLEDRAADLELFATLQCVIPVS